MALVNCGDPQSPATCRCDPITGCGHLSSWHVVTARWIAKCVVPGCECAVLEPCDCVKGVNEPATADSDEQILAQLGIRAT